MRAVVLFAHGARDPQWAEPFRRIRERVQAQLPQCHVLVAFLEIMRPSLPDAVEEAVGAGATQVSVFPLFMAQGGHLREDLPKLLAPIRERHGELDITLESALGEVPEVLEAIAGWIVARAS